MAAFKNCCKSRLQSMAHTIDSQKKYPKQAQFLRSLTKLSAEDAKDKLTPWWPWSDEWWEALKGIGERPAYILESTAWYPISAQGSVHTSGGPYHEFWSALSYQMYQLWKHETRPK